MVIKSRELKITYHTVKCDLGYILGLSANLPAIAVNTTPSGTNCFVVGCLRVVISTFAFGVVGRNVVCLVVVGAAVVGSVIGALVGLGGALLGSGHSTLGINLEYKQLVPRSGSNLVCSDKTRSLEQYKCL